MDEIGVRAGSAVNWERNTTGNGMDDFVAGLYRTRKWSGAQNEGRMTVAGAWAVQSYSSVGEVGAAGPKLRMTVDARCRHQMWSEGPSWACMSIS